MLAAERQVVGAPEGRGEKTKRGSGWGARRTPAEAGRDIERGKDKRETCRQSRGRLRALEMMRETWRGREWRLQRRNSAAGSARVEFLGDARPDHLNFIR